MASVRKCKDFDELSKIVQERIKTVADRLQKINGKTLSVGVDPNAKYPDGELVSQVAKWIEYGTSRMAPRPFLRNTIIAECPKWRRAIKETVAQVAAGKGGNYKSALQSVANMMKDDVQKSITDFGAVRTGKLRSSVQAEVIG